MMLKKCIIIFLLASLLNSSLGYSDKISPALFSSSENDKTLNVLISFKSSSSQNDLNNFYSSLDEDVNMPRAERLNSVTNFLENLANRAQTRVLSYLSSTKTKNYMSIWISNQISLRNVDLNLLKFLVATFPEISSIEEEGRYYLDDYDIKETESGKNGQSGKINEGLPQWNIEKIGAPEAWDLGYSGEGVVVGTIDTGVYYNHINLIGNFRGEYGWFDPYYDYDYPWDPLGHGTHVMGILAGNGGIGVAPGAKWMSCRGCYHEFCLIPEMLKCGEWILCPFIPNGPRNCSMAPHIVSNSWGSGSNDSYRNIVDAWRSAGIHSVFSAGNKGPRCGYTQYPADFYNVMSVGSTDEFDVVTNKSSVGPSHLGELKPDFTAPGSYILSAHHLFPDELTSMQGSSMAAPALAGLLAILKSRNITLNYKELYTYAKNGTEIELQKPAHCVDVGGNWTFPNYHYGHGRISVINSLKLLLDQEES